MAPTAQNLSEGLNSSAGAYLNFQTPFPTALTQSQIFMLKSSRPLPEPDGRPFSPVPGVSLSSSNLLLKPAATKKRITVYAGPSTRRMQKSTSSRNLKENSSRNREEQSDIVRSGRRRSSVSPKSSRTIKDMASTLDISRTAVKTMTTDGSQTARRMKNRNSTAGDAIFSSSGTRGTGLDTSHTLRSTDDLQDIIRQVIQTKKRTYSKSKRKLGTTILLQPQSLASPFTSRPSSPSPTSPPYSAHVPSNRSDDDNIFNPKRTLAETYYNTNLGLPARKRLNTSISTINSAAVQPLPTPIPISIPHHRDNHHHRTTSTRRNQQIQSKSTHTSPSRAPSPSSFGPNLNRSPSHDPLPRIQRRPSYPTNASRQRDSNKNQSNFHDAFFGTFDMDMDFSPLSSLGVVDFDRPPSQLSLYMGGNGNLSDGSDGEIGFGGEGEEGEMRNGDSVGTRAMQGWLYNDMFGKDLFGASTPYKRQEGGESDLRDGLENAAEVEGKDEDNHIKIGVDKLAVGTTIDLASKLKERMKSKPIYNKLQTKIMAQMNYPGSLPASPSTPVSNYFATGTITRGVTRSLDDITTSMGLSASSHRTDDDRIRYGDRSPWVTDSLISPPTFYLRNPKLVDGGAKGQQTEQTGQGPSPPGTAAHIHSKPQSDGGRMNGLGVHARRACQDPVPDRVQDLASGGVGSLPVTGNTQETQVSVVADGHGVGIVNRTRSGTILAPPARISSTTSRTRSGTIISSKPIFPTRTRSGTITAHSSSGPGTTQARGATAVVATRSGSGSIRAPVGVELGNEPGDESNPQQVSGTSIPEGELVNGATVTLQEGEDEGYLDSEFHPNPVLALAFSPAPNPDILPEDEDEGEDDGIMFSPMSDPLNLRHDGPGGDDLDLAWQIIDEPPSPFVGRGLRLLKRDQNRGGKKNGLHVGKGLKRGNKPPAVGGSGGFTDLSPSTDPIDFLSFFDEPSFNLEFGDLDGPNAVATKGKERKKNAVKSCLRKK